VPDADDPMKVLVTGHEGYLGVVAVAALRAAGHEVHGLDSGLFRRCTLGDEPPSVPAVQVDLREVEPKHLIGFDAVLHLAALSNDPLGDLAPGITYDINHHASVRLGTLARDAGVRRFIYASTCSVYGSRGGDDALDEDAELAPVTAYAVSKVRVEEDLTKIADDDFAPVFMRNATAFGFSPRPRLDVVVNNLVATALMTGVVRVMSDGTPWRPLVHARDIAAGAVALLEAPHEVVKARAYNIGSDSENLRVSEIAQLVADAVPGSTIEITGENGGDPRSYRVDFSRIRKEVPAFETKWTVAQGAVELAREFRARGLTPEGAGLTYIRLRWLHHLQAAGELDEDLRWIEH
jgi:nucleoside-diphosphate-sugar epimerase